MHAFLYYNVYIADLEAEGEMGMKANDSANDSASTYPTCVAKVNWALSGR